MTLGTVELMYCYLSIFRIKTVKINSNEGGMN